MLIRGTAITTLQGLENVGSFGNELSIERNPNLITIRDLGSNLPDSHRIYIRNIKIRNNPLLQDLEGLRYLQSVDGGWNGMILKKKMWIYAFWACSFQVCLPSKATMVC